MRNSINLQAVSEHLNNRRNFLKGTLLFSAGALLSQHSRVRAAAATLQNTDSNAAQRSKVSFVAGKDRRDMITKVLEPWKDEIQKGIQGKQVIIKPNFVGTNNLLCATHPDAVRAVLDFLKPMNPGKIIIGESSASQNTMPGFENYGYLALEKEYNVSCQDFNTHTGSPYWIVDGNLRPVRIEIISEFLDPKNYFISMTRLKTHNSVIATLGLKNMVMGCPLNAGRNSSYKRTMHGSSSRWLHYNMYLVAQKVRPQLTVLDGLEGMQGNGPMNGTPVEHGVSLAGTDVMAVDSIGAQLMDVPLENLGYLNYCGDAGLGVIARDRIDIIGDAKPADHIIKYELAGNIEQQLEWKQPLQLQGQQGGRGGFGGGFGGGNTGGGARRGS
ncbi:MAG: DUF362 domain-containing protein [Sedimentisphaerales bacterium]|nr:DUF362 domain-containing protein [Sedimentisphaerales bacterium]